MSNRCPICRRSASPTRTWPTRFCSPSRRRSRANVPASGIILNDLDRKKLQALKDSENRYLGAGPFSAAGNTLWNLPVVDTTSVASGTFFVGAFDIAAQLIDRMATEVIISTG